MNGFTTDEMKRFNYLIGETNAAYHEAALRFGLSDSTLQILYAICNNGISCPLSDICKLSGMSKQTINSALRKLEADGILYLEVMDGRRKNVCLTDKGRELASNTAVRLIEIENSILDSWTKQEQEAYLTLTRKFLTDFQEKMKEK